MIIKNHILSDYIKHVGTTSFSLYCYVVMKNGYKFGKIKITSFINALNLTKPTVIHSIKKLKRYNLIEIKTKYKNGVKVRFFKALQGKVSLPSYPNIYNINHLISNKESKNSNKYRKIFKKVISIALEFPRYNNDYYRNRRWNFGKKEKNHIITLVNHVKNVENYMEWWLNNKASRLPGLNLGLICCFPMIEEYKLKKGIPLINRDEKREAEEQDNMKMQMIEKLLEEIRKGKSLNKTDKEFLRECRVEGLVKKIDGKYTKNF